jgi:hypothetical protein
MAFALGTIFCIPGVAWLVMLWRWRPTDAPLDDAATAVSSEEQLLEGRLG